MAALFVAQRPSDGPAHGVLVLCHGRGTDEQDLLGLAAGLTAAAARRRPRAPLQLPGSPGYHWYRVPRVGYPDPETFDAARGALAELQRRAVADHRPGPRAHGAGGFSMGTVMSYTLGLDPRRPPVAGIMAFSGFIPTVEGRSPP